MKKNYIFTALLLSANLFSIAQTPPAIQWQKSLGGSSTERAESIEQTFDSGYIVAGLSLSNDGDVSGNHGDADYWIVKLNGGGAIQWQKSLGGSNYEYAHSIKQTFDSGYIVAGYSYSNDDEVSGNHGDADYWIVKLDSDGIIQWEKSIGGSGHDEAHSIQQTSDSGYIVAGFTDSNDGDVSGNHGSYDYWIVKLDSSGTIQWQKSLGGSIGEIGYSIESTLDSGYIVGGRTRSNDGDVSGLHSFYSDYWIVKLTGSGVIEWQKCLGGTGNDYGYSIKQTSDSGYIVAGSSDSNDGDVSDNHGSLDYWIAKLSSNGSILWQKSIGGSSGEEPVDIKQTSDNGYIIAGYSVSDDGDVSGNHGDLDYWIVKLDSIGTIQWQKSLGGSSFDQAFSIKQTSDNGYVVTGNSGSNDGDVSGAHGSVGGLDFWVVKLEPDALLPITLLSFSGEVIGKQNLLHWITATEINNTGFELQRSIDGNNFDEIGFINSGAFNGNSNSNLNYDFTDNNYSASTNYYRLKQIDKDGKFSYSNIVVLRDNNSIEPGLSVIYPNPAKSILNVKVASQRNNKITLLITDLSGKLLQTIITQVSNGETIVHVDVERLPAGTYFLKILSAGSKENFIRKFAKE